ncbi:fatty acyl-AMP ligase [Amycolatopsis sp. YIM 10]|uniref:fatty acyl-AMP ligase n=1 Tax=Amycolatopsis sp. YIM 10 TaxID=2653857 RepID=UPI00128FD006|nr:fatty acyl-AMP ligase [Amycolatopsis sp. YIM 10]QFU91888.1 Long-chain-fatty-acid--AMP ligase FadD32 [Amycolatopsis sp. YIM 10]
MPDQHPAFSRLELVSASLAARAGDNGPAFTFIDYLDAPEGTEHTLSWAELDRRARAVAARLTEVSAPGERVALLCPQNLDYVTGFFGALYAGMVAVPLFAPEVSSHAARLVGALADCDPEVWLTSESATPGLRELLDRHPVPRPKQLLAVDSLPEQDFEPVRVSAEQPAYLQYTSGSTRKPAGAVITHRALAANVRQVRAAFGVDENSTCAGWLPLFHDMGLVNLVALPAGAGCRSVFTTPFAFIRKPARWLRMISAYPGVITAAPNFAFDYAARSAGEDLAGLDLSRVEVMINGSEPIRPETVDAFLAATGPLGFRATAHRPSYGLAEATVLVSTTVTGEVPKTTTFDRTRLGPGERTAVVPGDDDRAAPLVSVGHAVGQALRIVVDGREVPDGVVGEIWLHGPNLAAGYWRQADRSAEAFDGYLIEGAPAAGWLRTGDLGVRHDGELYITGRLKDLIIVDGTNHYPQDIEVTVQQAHPAIRRDRLAAFAVERDGHEGPVVVAEHTTRVKLDDELRGDVGRQARAAVSRRHDLRLLDFVLVPPGTVTRTSSGKIARAAMRRRYLAGELG